MRTKDRQLQYDQAYMAMAAAMASLSYAERKKVGAIIVSTEDQVIAQGYNGTPHGFDNACEYRKQLRCNYALSCKIGECSHCQKAVYGLETKEEVLHAETNAITKCAMSRGGTLGSTLYVTVSPCYDCAKVIIQSGIKRVVYAEPYRLTDGISLLKQAGIEVDQVQPLEVR